MRIALLAMCVLPLATLASAQTVELIPPTTQAQEPSATSQPDNGELVAPSVTGAGASVGTTAPLPVSRGNELTPAVSAPQPPAVPAAPQTAEDIMNALLAGLDPSQAPRSSRPGEVMKSFAGIDEQHVAVKPSPPTKEGDVVPLDQIKPAPDKKLPEGFIVQDRAGHVVRDRGRWVFVFDADKNGAADAPLILLPCTQLRNVLTQCNYGQTAMKFRVTGEVTTYDQTNFLLLRKAIVEHNMDRFVN